MSKMPKAVMDFQQSGISIADLVSPRVNYDQSDYPWAGKMLGKFPLPKWQRESVWTNQQKISFIESAFYGYDLGSIVLNGYVEASGGRMLDFSDCLIDGQQRIGCMLDYIDNQFSVRGLFWRDLEQNDKRRFLRREIGLQKTQCFDEKVLKQVYNHLNFSGTQHEASQRA